MKSDLKKLNRLFSQKGIKNGDLVVTFEIHRVLDVDWGQKRHSRGIAVATVFPICGACGNKECRHAHIMQIDGAGRQSAARLVLKGASK